MRAVNTSILAEVHIRPPFRELLQHEGFLIEWMMDNIENVATAVAFLGTDVTEEICLNAAVLSEEEESLLH